MILWLHCHSRTSQLIRTRHCCLQILQQCVLREDRRSVHQRDEPVRTGFPLSPRFSAACNPSNLLQLLWSPRPRADAVSAVREAPTRTFLSVRWSQYLPPDQSGRGVCGEKSRVRYGNRQLWVPHSSKRFGELWETGVGNHVNVSGTIVCKVRSMFGVPVQVWSTDFCSIGLVFYFFLGQFKGFELRACTMCLYDGGNEFVTPTTIQHSVKRLVTP